MSQLPTPSDDYPTRTSRLPRHVSAPCGRVTADGEVLGRMDTRNDGEKCGSGACYAVFSEKFGGEILTCEHHREAAENGEFL